MLFYVKSVTEDGKESNDILEYHDYDALIESLNQKNLIPIQIYNIPSFLSFFIPKGGKKVNTNDIIELMENLHLIIKSGLPLYQGILDIASDTNNKRFRNMLEQIAFDINRGKPLSEAFEKYKKLIGSIVLNLIKIGEETGELETTLKRASEFLNKITDLKKKTKSALIYPSFAFAAITSAMLVWMVYVLPQMIELFNEMDVELPPMTRFMIAVSNFLNHYIVHILILTVIFISGFIYSYKNYKKFRYFVDKMLLGIPVIKNVISSFNMAFISEYLRLALISGVPIFNALELLKNNIGNELYKEALNDASEEISSGVLISDAFSKTKMFAPFMIRMISVGESAGTLDNQLNLVSDYYYEKVDYFAQNIGKIIEPVMLIIAGGFMAFVMIGLMGPLYDLISKIE